jgi:small conductance mechanosensitive channel
MHLNLEVFYDKAYDWILNFGPRIIIAVLVFILAQWIIRLIRKWMNAGLHKRGMQDSLKPFLVSLAVTVLQVLLALIILQILGLQLTVFTAIIGGVSVAAGLALSGTLQNFTSGILILLLKPYRVGDDIIAQGHEGTVKAIQIFYTIVTTYNNQTVILPNSKLSNEVIVNLSQEGIRRLDIEWKFSFAFSFNQVSERLFAVIKTFPGILQEPTPEIGIFSIETDGYRIAINVWVNAHDFNNIKFDFQEKLIEELKSAGLKLPGMS